MWICLDCLLRPDSWGVVMCEDSIVLPSGILAVISIDIITGAVVRVACFSRCTFATESEIASMLLLGGLGGVLIQFIKLILGLLISILFIAAPNHHLHPFSLPPSLFLW